MRYHLSKKCMLGFLLFSTLLFSLFLQAEEQKNEEPEIKKEEILYLKDTVKGFISFEGFIESYQDPKTSNLYFSLKKDQLGKEFIYFAHVKDGVATGRRNRGSYLDNGIFKFEKHFETLRLIRVNTAFSIDKETALSRSSGANISDSVIQVFPIKNTDKDKKLFLIDVSNLFLSEALTPITPMPYPNAPPPKFTWGKLSAEKSRIRALFNYPENTDVEIEYVFESAPSMAYEEEDAVDPRNITISMRYSFIQIPENDFEPRLDDHRIGYFTERITDLSSKDVTPYSDLINKWNLRKKNTEEKISEPIKPITFWIENTTPLELREYIKDGVLAWNIAFEKAGFKNALEVKIQPDDAKWDAGDIRYNVLRWTSSPNPPFGGYGPSFTNPRTGEIIGADIMLEWAYLTNRIVLDQIFPVGEEFCYAGSYTQEGNLLANLASITKNIIPDPKIVEQSIIRLTLHEVGHTLGLNHNFKASFLHDPINIHKPEITQKYGVTSSVMEYPAVNIAPLGIQQGDYYDVVPGAYDQWAIEFGYRQGLTKNQRENLLSKSDQPELMFGNDADDMRRPGKGIDPRAMTNDLSNDPITYAEQRIQLVNQTLKELPTTLSNPSTWEEYVNATKILLRETGRSLDAVSRYIGGVYVNRLSPSHNSNLSPLEPVPEKIQRNAMKIISEHAFSKNAFPISGKLLSIMQQERRGFDFSQEHEDPSIHRAIMSIQSTLLSHLLSGWTLERISDSRLYGNTYTTHQVMTDLTDAIFSEDINSEVSTVRQNLQALYTRRLIKLLDDSPADQMSGAAAYNSLLKIEKIARKRSSDADTQIHRDMLLWLIESALNKD